ncbi:MAG: DMT family transporter [Polyangiaceae bacterium]|nr:DMT family transporter [Polyangiaceae bacterium]
MRALLIALAVGVGMILPLQSGINAELRRHTGHPLWAAVTNFGVGLFVLSVVVAVMGIPMPSLERMGQAPLWSYLGGICGASLVLTAVIAAPKLGAALLVACLVAGQLGSSVVIDHFGWVGYSVRPISGGRILGLLLLVVGVVLIERSS